MTLKTNILTLLLGLFFSFSISAQVGEMKVASIFDVLSFQEQVEVNLELDMEDVFGNRKSKEKFPAVFSFQDALGQNQTWDIKVNLRGKFRRTKCENLPPLKLNFKKDDLAAKGLATFDDMKLVTFCVSDNKMAKQLIVKEYLAYKLYNEISDKSFRVQFLKINFKDVVSGNTLVQYGFVIEDAAELRNRINAKKCETVFNTPKESFEMEELQKLSVFQYMIGNIDWSLERNHNVKIYIVDDKKVAIPYDFDFSGFVSAPYVMIDQSLFPIQSVKERIYLGFDKNQESLENTLKDFLSKRKALIEVVKNSKLITRKDKRELTRYLNSFFREMNAINFRDQQFEKIKMR